MRQSVPLSGIADRRTVVASYMLFFFAAIVTRSRVADVGFLTLIFRRLRVADFFLS